MGRSTNSSLANGPRCGPRPSSHEDFLAGFARHRCRGSAIDRVRLTCLHASSSIQVVGLLPEGRRQRLERPTTSWFLYEPL
jgi:hypothetical protein